ncbi:MAG: hypothetical protein HZB99_00780 [Candidatus Harrisonbacteria bacterium]|nr:hypothetical protein [Candidatus Harrisonbacteria bacterium]
MGAGSVNYWAGQVKLFEREDALALILEELKKRNLQDYNNLLECGRLVALAVICIGDHVRSHKSAHALLVYLKETRIEEMLDEKLEKLFKETPKPPEDISKMTEKDYKHLMTHLADCSELSEVRYYIRFLKGGLEKANGSQ